MSGQMLGHRVEEFAVLGLREGDDDAYAGAVYDLGFADHAVGGGGGDLVTDGVHRAGWGGEYASLSWWRAGFGEDQRYFDRGTRGTGACGGRLPGGVLGAAC